MTKLAVVFGTFSLVIVLALCGEVRCEDKAAGSERLISADLAKASGLEIIWENHLPIRGNESLERLHILGNRMYALSDRNYMVALNRANGKVIFSKLVAQPGFEVLGLKAYEKELLSVIGNKLVEIDQDTGTVINTKRMQYIVTCPAERNSEHVYVGGVDRRMHALRVGDKVQIFEVAAEDDSAIVAIFADEDRVVFGTDTGKVICILPDRPTQLWQFDAAGGIVGPIIQDGDSLYFASKDTNVYKIDALKGKFIWKYPSGAVLERGVVLTEDVVYQHVYGRGLAAIDKDSGQVIWKLAEGLDLLSESRGKAYVITDAGKLVVMDNIKAKRLYCVNFAKISRYGINVSGSKIYVADKAGRIACLKPVR